MVHSETEVHAVYRIVEKEAKLQSKQKVADELGISREMVSEAMDYFLENPFDIHEDVLTCQYWFFKDKMQDVLEARYKISQDCPSCESGTLVPEHLFPQVRERPMDYRSMAFRVVSCRECGYDYSLSDSFKGFSEGFQIQQQGEDQLYTIETRLIDWDDATIWYLVRDHGNDTIDHVTHQQLTEEFEVYTGE